MAKFIVFFILIFTILLKAETDKILTYRENISNFYYKFLDNSTSFLYDCSNYEYIKKHNKLRFYLNTVVDDKGHISSSPSIRADIKLPKLGKNLFLSVEKDSKVTDNPNEKETPTTHEEKSSRVGLKYYFIRQNTYSFFAKLGGRPTLSGNKFYSQIGIEKLKKINTHYIFTYFHEYYYFKDKIFKSDLGINYKKPICCNLIFLQNNNITIEDNQPTYLTNSFVLDQYINPKTSFSYWISLFSEKNKSLKLNSISYNFKCHYLIKKWIFVDIIPSYVTTLHEERSNSKYLYLNFGFIF